MNRIRTAASAGALTALFLLAGCLGETNTGPDDPPSVSGPFLVFVSDRAGLPDLYRIETDGSGRQRLTGFPGEDGAPDCSADGSRVAFESVGRRGQEDATDVYTLDRTPTVRRITIRSGEGELDYGPAWSPDGNSIAFISSGRDQFGGAQDRVVIMRDDGTHIQGVGDDVQGRSLDWSFQDHGLAISTDADGDGDLDLVRMDADGSNVQTLSADPDMDEIDPAWSGAGDRVAFALSDPTGGGADIYTVRADGTGLTRLTDHEARDVGPALSPDGSQIAFASDRSGNWEVYVMATDGTGLQRVTDHPARDEMPAWCPR